MHALTGGSIKTAHPGYWRLILTLDGAGMGTWQKMAKLQNMSYSDMLYGILDACKGRISLSNGYEKGLANHRSASNLSVSLENSQLA